MLSWYHATTLCAPGLLLALALGCSKPYPNATPGVSQPTATEEPEQREPAAQPSERWSEFERVRAWAPLTAEPFVSQGHAGRYRAHVRVSPEAEAIYRALVAGATFPEGTIAAKFHQTSDGRSADVFVLQLTASGWEFRVLSAEGQLVTDAELGLCARCHAESPAAPLFGLPRKTE